MIKRLYRAAGSACFFLLSATVGPKAQQQPDSIVYESKTEWRTFPSRTPVTAFDVRGNLVCVGTENAVTLVDIRRGTVSKRFSRIGTIEAPRVMSVAIDHAGGIWVGAAAGCAVYRRGKWHTFTPENGLPAALVLSLCVDRTRRVWIGTGKGLCFAGAKGLEPSAGENAPGAVAIRDMTTGEGDDIWCATAKGIYRRSAKGWQAWTMRDGLNWNDAYAIAWDPRKKHAWARVGERDVNQFTGTEWNVFMDVAGDIGAIMVDTQCRVWFGSTSQGLIKFNGEEWISDPAKHGLSARSITSLHRDGGGNLWFGTEVGVVRLTNPYPF